MLLSLTLTLIFFKRRFMDYFRNEITAVFQGIISEDANQRAVDRNIS